jgi:molybdopterin/thiamine biosynthesis adenylyltransferase
MSNIIDPRFDRNLGFLNIAEQQAMSEATVAIAGAGGDGGALALQLARLGVGSFRLADPDPFEVENSNRQAVCTTETVGVNKAEAVGAYLQKINPSINVEVFSNGVNTDNTPEFVDGATLVVDETEYTLAHLGVGIAREARPRGIPVLTALNVGFGALVTTFDPNSRHTLERMLGIPESMPLEQVAEQEIPLSKWLPYIPTYADLAVFEKVAKGEKSAPSIAPGVAIASALGATQAVLNIVNGLDNRRPRPIYAPKARVMDVMTGTSKEVRFSILSHYRHALPMLARNLLKLNPKASY